MTIMLQTTPTNPAVTSSQTVRTETCGTLLHGPLDADIVRVRILPRSILCQLLSDDAVGCPSQAVSHSRKAAHCEAF